MKMPKTPPSKPEMVHLDDLKQALRDVDTAVRKHEWNVQKQLLSLIHSHVNALTEQLKVELVNEGKCPHDTPIQITALGDPAPSYICPDCAHRWTEGVLK